MYQHQLVRGSRAELAHMLPYNSGKMLVPSSARITRACLLQRLQTAAACTQAGNPLLMCTPWKPNSPPACRRERAWDRYVAQLLQERDNPALATARREREERDRARTSRDARC